MKSIVSPKGTFSNRQTRYSSTSTRKSIMKWISLEVKLLSCQDLKAFNFFQKLSIQAVVSIFNDELNTAEQRQKSPIDRGGGRNPEWNHLMEFNLKGAIPEDGDHDHVMSHLFLRFVFRREGVNLFNYRTLGEVKVPVKDLIDGASDFNGMVMRFVSYQVRTSDGKPNGVLNFSYKVKGEDKKEGINDPPLSPSLKKNIETFSGKFVRYPSLEISPAPRDTGRGLYPSLDDGWSLPSGKVYVAPPNSQFCATPPPEIVPAPTFFLGHGASSCSYQLPAVQTPRRYCWCTRQTTSGNCSGFHGNVHGGWAIKNC